MGDAEDGYVGTDSFNIKITFSGAGGTPTNFDAENISISAGNTWLVRDVAGSGLVYTARILPPSNAQTDAPNVVITLEGTVTVDDDDKDEKTIFVPENADGDDDGNPGHRYRS